MDIVAVENSLKRKVIAPVYLFHGEETYLWESLLEKFKDTLLPPEVRDFNLDLVDGREHSPDNIIAMAGTLPFLAEKRLVIVQNADYFKNKKKSTEPDQPAEEPASAQDDVLLSYLENPSTATCLIFTTAEGVNRQKKVYKALEKVGQVVNFSLLKGQDLQQWIRQRVNQQGREISGEAIRYLMMAVGSNLRMLDKEIAKLLTSLGQGPEISGELVTELVSKQVDITVFQLVDAVAEKRFSAALEYTQDLLFQGEPPVKILSLLTRQFRLIWQTKLYFDQGCREQEVATNLKVKSFVVNKCVSQGRNFRQEDLRQAFRVLLETDYRIKTGQQEPVVALEMALMKLCSSI